jgi:hypothetical protein
MKRRLALLVLAAIALFLLVPQMGQGAQCSATPTQTGLVDTTLPELEGHTNVKVNTYTYVGGRGSSEDRNGSIYGNVGVAGSLAGFYFGGDDNSPTAAQGCVQASSICLSVPNTICNPP